MLFLKSCLLNQDFLIFLTAVKYSRIKLNIRLGSLSFAHRDIALHETLRLYELFERMSISELQEKIEIDAIALLD